MSGDTYFIPANFTDAGRVLGLFEIRNVIEAVLLTISTLFLCIYLLPLPTTPKIIVTFSAVVPIGGFGLMGIADESLSKWLYCWWRWRRARRIISYRGEVKSK